MVHIYRRKAKRRHKEEGIKKGQYYYECKYRKKILRSKTYIDRSSFSSSPLMRSLYQIDDLVFLFKAKTNREFLNKREVILDLIAELHGEFQEKLDKYQPDSIPFIVYTRRLQAFNSYYDKIAGITLDQGLTNAIKEIKKVKINLKPIVKS